MNSRVAWPLAVFISLGLAIMSLNAACSGHHRQDTLRVSRIAVNTARDSYLRWDRERQMKLVEQSATREERDRATAEHRKRRDAVNLVFAAVYDMLLDAALDKEQRSLDSATEAAAKLADAMKRLDPSTFGPDPDNLIRTIRAPCPQPCPSVVDAGLLDGATP